MKQRTLKPTQSRGQKLGPDGIYMFSKQSESLLHYIEGTALLYGLKRSRDKPGHCFLQHYLPSKMKHFHVLNGLC